MTSPSHSTTLDWWDAPFQSFSPLPGESSEEDIISIWANTASEFSSAESLDSRAQPSVSFPAPEYEGYLASDDVSEPEPLTSRYIPEAPVTPPRTQSNRPKRILYSATRRNEQALRAGIKASLATEPAVPLVPAVPSAKASTSRMPPPPVVAPVIDAI